MKISSKAKIFKKKKKKKKKTHSPPFYENVVKVWKCVTTNQSRAIFGFTNEDSMGKVITMASFGLSNFRATFKALFSNVAFYMMLKFPEMNVFRRLSPRSSQPLASPPRSPTSSASG